MDISECREAIDAIDRQIVDLFVSRMRVCGQVGAYKKAKGLPVTDGQREKDVLLRVAERTPEDLRSYSERLFTLLFEMSRDLQERDVRPGGGA